MKKVLVIGATGHLGGLVVDRLLHEGYSVRALVRPQTDAARLIEKGVEIVRGDLTIRESLPKAMLGADALITTAIGYAGRQKGDTLQSVDDLGNRNLIDVAKETGLRRFVFTSILTADKAVNVPHFHQKKIIEDYLEASGVPFVSIRPGGFLDSLISASDLENGRIRAMVNPNASASTILAEDVAACLVSAVEGDHLLGRKIEIGCDRPASLNEIVTIINKYSSKDIKLQTMPPMLTKLMMNGIGMFNPTVKALIPTMAYVESGQYVVKNNVMDQSFGFQPTVEDSIRRYLKQNNLIKPQ
ncbi:SDR family oxidoreductase [Metabacillus indicus]|uniref:SDR family oxidoreductase n=1 Tax=Metabacillus indicus TaxID=246786 RepID=UPI003177E4AE